MDNLDSFRLDEIARRLRGVRGLRWRVYYGDPDMVVGPYWGMGPGGACQFIGEAEFIAHAPEDIDFLLDMVERLEYGF